MQYIKAKQRFFRFLGFFTITLTLAACSTDFSQSGTGNIICANNTSCTQGAGNGQASTSSVSSDPSSSSPQANDSSSQSSTPGSGQSIAYQKVPFATLCQYATQNNFYDSCPGGGGAGFSQELDGHAYTFAALTLVGLPHYIAQFAGGTCKSLSLHLGIRNDPGADTPSDLTMTLTLTQENLGQQHVTVSLGHLVTWSVKLAGGTWEIDGEASNTNWGWPLLMDGTAICSTATGVSGD
jgi:hypothetical protein